MITETGKYYLYRHIREDKNEVFYVGIGTRKKTKKVDCKTVYYRAYTKDSRTRYWRSIVLKTKYYVDIILESDSRDFIFQKEKEFIALYGRKDLNKGTLVNVCDGGEFGVDIVGRSKWSIIKSLRTKRKNGTLSNTRNLIKWKNSPNYKPSKAKEIYLYLASSGEFVKKFISVKECGDFLGLKGSISILLNRCNSKTVYRNKYLFSWVDCGVKVDLSHFNLNSGFFRPVIQVDIKTGNYIKRFKSTAEAARHMGVNLSVISYAVCNHSKTLGFYWVRDTENNFE